MVPISSQLKLILKSCGILILGCSIYLVQLQIDRSKEINQKIESFIQLPKGEYLKVAVLGYDQLVADLLWLRVVQICRRAHGYRERLRLGLSCLGCDHHARPEICVCLSGRRGHPFHSRQSTGEGQPLADKGGERKSGNLAATFLYRFQRLLLFKRLQIGGRKYGPRRPD